MNVEVTIDKEKLALFMLSVWSAMHPMANWPSVMAGAIEDKLPDIIIIKVVEDVK